MFLIHVAQGDGVGEHLVQVRDAFLARRLGQRDWHSGQGARRAESRVISAELSARRAEESHRHRGRICSFGGFLPETNVVVCASAMHGAVPGWAAMPRSVRVFLDRRGVTIHPALEEFSAALVRPVPSPSKNPSFTWMYVSGCPSVGIPDTRGCCGGAVAPSTCRCAARPPDDAGGLAGPGALAVRARRMVDRVL